MRDFENYATQQLTDKDRAGKWSGTLQHNNTKVEATFTIVKGSKVHVCVREI